MKLPLIVLGVLAVVAGVANLAPVAKLTGAEISFLEFWLDGEYGAVEGLTYHEYHELMGHETSYIGSETLTLLLGAALSLGLAFAGAGLAYTLYNVPEPKEHTQRLGRAREVLSNNYYQDEYQVWLARDLTLPFSRTADRFDQSVIDGVVNGVSSVSLFGSGRVQRIQTGVVTNYAALIVLGFLALLVIVGINGGWFV